jgi:hypothetical protein
VNIRPSTSKNRINPAGACLKICIYIILFRLKKQSQSRGND